MDDAVRHRVNAGTAAGKVMEGEAIVINAVSGRYYSLDEAACVAWVHLAGGSTLADVVSAIVARYAVDSAVARADAVALAQQLADEDLLVLADGEAATQEPVDESELPPADGPRAPYATPELVTFKDMEDLLAFDPPLPVTEPHEWEWRGQ
ncbi:MAG: hypothetical protein QOJ63_979 [Solirubrobacteraceae bacterium]|nr:hypothetical protein [Solirubrobacteraceae bacterium]